MRRHLGEPRPITPANTQSTDRGVTSARWPGAAAVILSGIVCWSWLSSGAITTPPQSVGDAVTSELAQVDDQEITGALATMSGSSDFLSQFKKRESTCPQPLAWVSVRREAGQPATTIRLRSGAYFSPVFNLSEVPERVAIPFPAPYEAGHGTLIVMEAGGRAAVALTPEWHLLAQSGQVTREVTWRPRNSCKRPNG